MFNFVLAGTPARRLAELDDTLRPLVYGLRAAGHRVVAFGRRFVPPPAVNLVFSDTIAGPHDLAERARAEAGADVRVGLVCLGDSDGMAAPLRRLAGAVDFVWTESSMDFAGTVPPARIGRLGYGFHPDLLGPRFLPQERRSAGIIVYGEESTHRAALAERLTAAGLPVFFVRPGHFPDYLVTDLLSRAALAVVTRTHPTDRTPPAPRILKAICNGASVVVEAAPAHDFTLAACTRRASFDDLVDSCRAALEAGDGAATGRAALACLRAAPSMAEALAPAIAVASGSEV